MKAAALLALLVSLTVVAPIFAQEQPANPCAPQQPAPEGGEGGGGGSSE